MNDEWDANGRVVGHYNPVKVIDSLGAIFLGTLAIILLIALLRAQARNRALIARLAGG